MEARSVLVVDDSPTTLRVTSEAIRSAGFTVITAVDGEEALEKARAEQPAVVVLDIILPKKNGYQVCRELKTDARTQAIRVLMLTSKKHDADKAWGQKQGADAYMTKPYQDEELAAAVRELWTSLSATP